MPRGTSDADGDSKSLRYGGIDATGRTIFFMYFSGGATERVRCWWPLRVAVNGSRGRSVLGKIANAPAGQAHMIGALQQETATPASPTRYTMSYN